MLHFRQLRQLELAAIDAVTQRAAHCHPPCTRTHPASFSSLDPEDLVDASRIKTRAGFGGPPTIHSDNDETIPDWCREVFYRPPLSKVSAVRPAFLSEARVELFRQP